MASFDHAGTSTAAQSLGFQLLRKLDSWFFCHAKFFFKRANLSACHYTKTPKFVVRVILLYFNMPL